LGIFSPTQCCKMICNNSPFGPCIYIHATLRYIKLRQIQCLLIYNYRTLHSLNKIIWNVMKISRDTLSHVPV
jgi:hypothetical protein